MLICNGAFPMQELDENEEYVEREDEFDAEQEGAAAGEKAGAGAGDDGDGDVDIETVDPALGALGLSFSFRRSFSSLCLAARSPKMVLSGV